MSQAANLPAVTTLKAEVLSNAGSLGLALLIALFLRVILFQPFTIPSSSMEPGLVTGDYIVVSKFAYGWSRASLPFNAPLFRGRLLGRPAERGDVVVFRLPRDPTQTWIKRVIGLPGDHVQVRAGQVFVNGRAVPKSPVGLGPDHDAPQRVVMTHREETPSGATYLTYGGEPGSDAENTSVYVVPAGHYFVMGDNRDNSMDSRWGTDLGVGFLPAENIIGKAELILLSWQPGAGFLKPWTWTAFQPHRLLKQVH